MGKCGGRGKGDRQKRSGNITTDSSNIIQYHETLRKKRTSANTEG
jgi:hypothetical protein